MKYPLPTITIGTRDGTLTKDSKSINTLGGQRRPGLAAVAQLPVGAGQGMMLSPTLGALAIVGNSIYRVSTGLLVAAIPSGVGPYDTTAALPNGDIGIKDTTRIWRLNGSTVTAVTRASADPMVPGFIFLDSTYYVLTTTGQVQGSGLNDVTIWNALNYIALNADLGTPIALARQLNYVVGFADTFTSFFYDAGNPAPGSPLSPVQNAYSDIGCAAAGSVVEIIGMLFFLGKSATKGRSVYSLTGTQYQVVSDPFVDRVLGLSTLASVSAMSIKIAGRDIYLLTLRDLGITLALDITARKWELWASSTTVTPDPAVANSYAQTYFLCSSYLNGNSMDLFQHETNGKVLQMLTTLYQDDGLPIDVQFITGLFEGETSDYQRIRAAEIVGSKVNSTAYIRFTNDDYQTWSTYQPVNLLQRRSRTVRQGKSSRRAYQIRHTDNTSLDLRDLVLEITSAPIAP